MLVSRVAALLLAGVVLPCTAFAAGTVTTVAPYDHTVMRDGATRLDFLVTNDNSGAINQVEFRFAGANDQYDLSDLQQVTLPAGWFITLFNANRVVFTSFGGIPNGGTEVFTLWMTGNGSIEIPPANSDATDRFSNVFLRRFSGPDDTLNGPTWTRHGFKLTLEATPPSVPVGGAVAVRYRIENRTSSALSKTFVASVPAAPAVSPAGIVTGPAATTPPTTTVTTRALGGAAELSWTGTAQAEGVATFSARVLTNAGGATSSPTMASNPVSIGDFTAAIAISPDVGLDGTTFDVEMTVTNHGTISLGGIVPSVDPVTRSATTDPLSIGSAPGAFASGPQPASVASLGPGDSAVFRWTWTAAGAASGDTVQFQGGAIANGAPNVTNLATSNVADIREVAVYVTPDAISQGDSGPLTFVAENGFGFDLDEDFRFSFPAGFVVVDPVPAVPGYTASVNGAGNQVTYSANPGVLWDDGESLQFPMTFSSVPATTGTGDQEYMVEVRLLNLGDFHDVTVLVTENRVALAVSPGSVAADGSSTVQVDATVTDGGGLPVAGRTVTFETTDGTLSSSTAVTGVTGVATVTLTAPASATTVNATVRANLFNAVDEAPVTFTAFSGANLLYVGGTLYQREVSPGSLVAFSIYVTNAGTAAANLTTAGTHFDFSCSTGAGSASYTSNLVAPMTVPAGTTAEIAFGSVAVPASCIGTPSQVVFPTFTFNPTRTVTDSVTITATPTFASVVDLAAEPWGEGARLTWRTEMEWDNLGFRVLRADGAGEPAYLDVFVPASGGLFGDYEAVDPAPASGDVRAWWIEDVAIDGTLTRHGPVFLDADPFAESVSSPGLVAAAGGSRPGSPAIDDAVWEDPFALPGVRVLAVDAAGITFEIEPPEYELTELAFPVERRHRLRIPGWSVLQRNGEPDLPVLHVPLAPPRGTRAVHEILSVDEAVVPEIRPTWYAGPVGAGATPAPLDAGTQLRPADAAHVHHAGWSAERGVSSLVVTPLRWDPLGESLHVAHRLVVRVRWTEEPAPAPPPGSAEELEQARILSGPAVEVLASREGLVRVPVSTLSAAGIAPASAAVYRHGRAIPSRVENGELLFVAPSFESPYPGAQSFWIAPGSGATLLRDGAAPAAGGEASIARHAQRLEQNTWFAPLAGQGDGADRWYWLRLFTGGTVTTTIPIPVAAAETSATGAVTLELQGLFDDPEGDGDHVVRARLNGTDLGTATLSALERVTARFEVPAGVVAAGSNSLQLDLESALVSSVALDSVRFEWGAPADAALADELVVESLADGVLTATGLASVPAFAIDETDPSAPRLLALSAAEAAGSWRASVDVEAGRVVRFVGAASASPATWSVHDGADPLDVPAGADYVVIAPEALAAAASGFADHRASWEGGALRTHLVTVESLYDRFTFGDVDPAAARRFLERASATWPAPAPRYVLLVGDSDADPKDHLGLGVPAAPLFAQRLDTSVLNVPSDALTAAWMNGDDLPDLAIGRLPARDEAEVEAMLAKTLDYETAPRDGWDRRQVVLADDDEPTFEALAEELATRSPLATSAVLASATQSGDAALRATALEEIEDGVALVTWVGHGGVSGFGHESYLASSDALENTRLPVFLAVDCMNAYFDHPGAESLAEELVRREDGGAVAFFGSTAITRDAGHRDLALAFHRAFWRQPLPRLGDVALAAVEATGSRDDIRDLAGTFQLVGDPALRLNVNGTPTAIATLAGVDDGVARLSGQASRDPESDALAYRWEIVERPAPDALGQLDDPSSPEPVLTGDSGRWRIRLRVADLHRASAPDDLVVELRTSAQAGGGEAPARWSCSVSATSRPVDGAFAALLLLAALAVRGRRASARR